MDRQALFAQIQQKKSYLCVGLDTDINKIPRHLLKESDPVFEFNKQIIDATAAFAVAYKPNLAFYEQLGPRGWQSLAKTVEYIPKEIFTIADAKRGDIGNTSNMYAKAFFEELNFDAITLAPYMGVDSVSPYLEYKDKWSIILALTSNASSKDFEQLQLQDGRKLYEAVLETSKKWASADQIMYVVGATKADELGRIRKLVPEHFFLVPGIGAQGGSLQEVSRNGLNDHCGLLVNSSRGIIYASNDEDFAKMAGERSKGIQEEMSQYLNQYCN
jgi:orotidine-5'-phosphate decarboxylase